MPSDAVPAGGGIRPSPVPVLPRRHGARLHHHGAHAASQPASRAGLLGLAAVALAFVLAVLVFTPVSRILGWDEAVYASQISTHVPMLWGAERARGLPLLVSPVTLLTSSATVLRLYLTVLGGIGLFAALACWRGVCEDKVLALSGLVFGGLWIVQAQASQVLPNFWIALGGLAGAGLFLRSARGLGGHTGIVLLGAAAAVTSLLRPPDAVALFGPLLLADAILVVRSKAAWRRRLRSAWPPAIAIASGLAVGVAEWAAEAVLYFGGIGHRLKLERSAVGGTRFAPLDSLRILSGGRVSSVAAYPGIHGWSDPWQLVWWSAFGILAIAGAWLTSRRAGLLLAVTPAACAACEYLLYSFPARDATRYLQPSWALLSVSAADGLAWLVTRPPGRRWVAAPALAGAFLASELVLQHAVLVSQVATYRTGAAQTVLTTSVLRQSGVRPPCIVTSDPRQGFDGLSEPVAYALGCQFQWTLRSTAVRRIRSRVVVLVSGSAPPPGYADTWPVRRLPGGALAYLESAGYRS